ncbi:Tom22p SCDLUD_002870 [Saccharomycodes ludwigii]|uniref:Tom22p n=1 Tax=Saccharomycodes ludwigii TaxID=36035 RepID=UPI001E897F1C|nr:hypothetical protein SCDLUD_002870 [Saccharomycodes ludwigii]KAH3901378.1 hypothetical protein SCDLUD_002870 [Saccharomycodes ludwigii]
MVEITEIIEDQNTQDDVVADVLAEAVAETVAKAEEEEEDDDDEGEAYASDDEDSDYDDFDENETLFERIVALKDIVPPKQRNAVCNAFSTTVNIAKSIFSKGGSLTWTIATSALLLGVPLSLTILAEQQLIEMEKTFDLQSNANDLLGSAPQQPVPSPAAQ